MKKDWFAFAIKENNKFKGFIHAPNKKIGLLIAKNLSPTFCIMGKQGCPFNSKHGNKKKKNKKKC